MAFDSIHGGKRIEILKAYGVPVETVDAVTMMYTNTTTEIVSPDGDTEFFENHPAKVICDNLGPGVR